MKLLDRITGILGCGLRLVVAVWLVGLCRQDLPSIEARTAFDELPPYDAAAEASELFNQNRFSEALLLVDEALEDDPDNARLLVIKQGLEIERRNWMRQLALGGRGAITGTGTEPAELAGAIVADLFVFGDVRDLVVQSGHWLKGEETDEVIVALSMGGILLTVSPSLDMGAAVLKLARRMGALSDKFARSLAAAAKQAVKTGKAEPVADITGDIARLSKRSTPSGTIAMLKHIDDPATLKLAANFAESPGGVRALLLDPKTTLRWLKSGWAPAETWLLKAAAKGKAGLRYLAENSTLMFRPHPLLGLAKGLYKGNIPQALVEFGRAWSLPVLGIASAWLAFEVLLMLTRLAAVVGAALAATGMQQRIAAKAAPTAAPTVTRRAPAPR